MTRPHRTRQDEVKIAHTRGDAQTAWRRTVQKIFAESLP